MMENNITTKIETCYGDKAYETIQELADGADSGDMLAAYYLAQYYEEGAVVPQDFCKAAELYMRVSECRDPLVFADPYMPLTPQCEAEYAIGCLYENGLLLNSSMEKAIHWFLLGAKDGGADACFKMAEIYLAGKHTEKDYELALKYLCDGYYCNFGHNNEKVFQLAMQLDGKTEYNRITILEIISNCYARGIGVEQDIEQAAVYCEKANQLHETNAKVWEELADVKINGDLGCDELPF